MINRKIEQRRQTYRAPISFPISYIRGDKKPGGIGIVSNISATGLRFLTTGLIGANELLSVTFTLPASAVREAMEKTGTKHEFKPMTLPVRVLASGNDKESKKHWYGVEFLPMPQSQADLIYRFVHLSQIPKSQN